MWKKHFSAGPGHAPPRPALAMAALAATLTLHGAVLGLFQRQAPRQMLVATPALERALAACRDAGDRKGQLACRQAVAERARQRPDLSLAGR